MDATQSPQPGNGGTLAARVAAAAREHLAGLRTRLAAPRLSLPPGRREWWIAGAVAVLLILGPLATIVGANILASRARTEAARLDATAAPRVAARAAGERDRAELATLLRRPTVGATIEAIAQALPPEAALLGASRNRDGLIEIEVRTPDPDKLRAALRRQPSLGGLRDAGQRQSDASMIVTFHQAQP